MITYFQRAVIVLLVVAAQTFAQAPVLDNPQLEQKVDAILSKMTLEQKIDMLGGENAFYIRAYKDLGIPRQKMSDGPLGVRNYGRATTFPAGIAIASNWDTALMQRVGQVIGQDARARGVHFMLGPGVNIYRAPMCGRDFEYYGEDPYLAARNAVAYINGMQSQGVIATIKHFAANNQEYARHDVDSEVDERTLREIYLPAFEAAVKEAHVGAIMNSYNLLNGEHSTQNDWLNNQLTKKEWGFDGVIMSDWDATYDGIAAANGGLDLEMPAGDHMNRATLLPAIQSGKVSQATIDDKVRRILRTAIRFGFFDRDQSELNIPRYNEQGRAVALEAARGGMVLLKNAGNLLPLDKTRVKTIAVIGPDAYPANPVGGGSARVEPFHGISFLEGISDYLAGRAKVLYNQGVGGYRDIFEHTDWSTEAQGGQQGLKVETFEGGDLSGTPAETSNDRHVTMFAPRRPRRAQQQQYAMRWSGYYVPQHPGEYRFVVVGHGAYTLFVDDKQVANEPAREGPTYTIYSAQLSGPAKVRLEYHADNSWPVIGMGVVDPASVVDPEAVQMAKNADAALVFVGFNYETESEGEDRTFRLPPGQDELVNAIAAANKNTIVVLTSGGGVDMTQWIDRVPALLQAWYAGQEGGTALAQLLFGDYSPSGKLAATFERRWEDNPVHDSYYPNDGTNKVKYTEGVFVGYRGYEKNNVKPLFPFGFGLSYTTFGYSNVRVTPASGNAPATVSFDVRNIGRREGAEIAEVYVAEPQAKVPRPLKELKGFAKVNLRPGETRHVSVTLDQRAFQYYDVGRKQWVADAGEYDILVGPSSVETPLKAVFRHQ